MDNGVKVTYIETQFVTSDAAGFKDLVQRLTGRSPTAGGAPTAPPHRPRPSRSCRAGVDSCGRSATAAASTAVGPQGWCHESPPAAHEARVGEGLVTPPCLELDETCTYYGVADFSDLLLYGSASQNAQCGNVGYYSEYFSC